MKLGMRAVIRVFRGENLMKVSRMVTKSARDSRKSESPSAFIDIGQNPESLIITNNYQAVSGPNK